MSDRFGQPGGEPRPPKRPTGYTAATRRQGQGTLAAQYGAPPFTLLDARQGYWQDRKRAWLALGIDSGNGRGDKLVFSDSLVELGKADTATSIFDPVLAELMMAWFSPPGGTVLDPFAGGSVRGLVAAKLSRRYTGIELRPEQVEANERQCVDVLGQPSGVGSAPVWITADSADLAHLVPGPYDLVFTCPPYFNLERYSDDSRDLSNMPWPIFCETYAGIFGQAVALLADDRFACVVVGDVRDQRGHYRNLPGETVNAFAAAGLQLYNEGVYITPTGSLPMRAGKQFRASRKLGKAHQNVLVFVKGDWRRAVKAVGSVVLADLAEVA